jgi:hypothetical protein
MTSRIARDYADAGLAPIRLGKRGKRPIDQGWERQPIDADAVDAWLAKGGNVGLRMGEQPDGRRIVALDEDEPGSFDAAAKTLGELPATLTARTGSGGRHSLFLWPAELPFPKNRVRALPGLDVRGEGAQIVVEPSIHPDTGERYQWVNDGAPAELPRAWCEALLAPGAKTERTASRGPAAATARVARVVGAMYPHYAAGGRHDLVRGLGGWLARQDWPDEEIQAVVEALPSDKPPVRVRQALDAAARARAGEPSPGWEVLSARLGEDAPRLEGAAASTIFRAWRAAQTGASSTPWARPAGSLDIGAAKDFCDEVDTDWDADVKPVEYLCEPLRLAASRGKISLIAGMPGSAKGPLAGYLAMSFALGGGAFHCKQARTLILDCEGSALTKNRIQRMARAADVSRAELRDRLFLKDCTTDDLVSDAWFQWLEAYVRAREIGVVVLDSYTTAMLATGADPNKIEFATLAKTLAGLGVLVLAVAHTNKAPLLGERPTLGQVAGSFALGAMAQTGITIWRPAPTKDEPDPTRLQVACMRAPQTSFEGFDIEFADTDGGAGLALSLATKAEVRRDERAERLETLAHRAARVLSYLRDVGVPQTITAIGDASGVHDRDLKVVLPALREAGVLRFEASVRGKGLYDLVDPVDRPRGVVFTSESQCQPRD